MVERVLRYVNSRLDTIPACDGRTDGQPSFDSKDRAYAYVARVKSPWSKCYTIFFTPTITQLCY